MICSVTSGSWTTLVVMTYRHETPSMSGVEVPRTLCPGTFAPDGVTEDGRGGEDTK